MCWGKKQTYEAPKQPEPAPMPVAPSEIEPQVTSEERRQRVERLRRGLVSTIKTSSRGLTGTGPDLATQTLTGKKTLG